MVVYRSRPCPCRCSTHFYVFCPHFICVVLCHYFKAMRLVRILPLHVLSHSLLVISLGWGYSHQWGKLQSKVRWNACFCSFSPHLQAHQTKPPAKILCSFTDVPVYNTDLTRQYKTMQSEMALRIHMLEQTVNKLREQLGRCLSILGT